MSKTSIQFSHPWRPIESGMKQAQIQEGVVVGFNTDHILSVLGDANMKAIKIAFATEIRPTTLLLDKEDGLSPEETAKVWNAARDMIAEKLGMTIEPIVLETEKKAPEASGAPTENADKVEDVVVEGDAGLVAGAEASAADEVGQEGSEGQEGAATAASEADTSASTESDRADDPVVVLEEPLQGE